VTDLVESLDALLPWADVDTDVALSNLCADIFECQPAAAALTHLVNITLGCSNGNGDYVEGAGGSGSAACVCRAPWVGPACQYSAATTCSGHGVADGAGGCECASADNAFYGNYTGSDCSGLPLLMALEDEEDARYTTYYIAFGVVVALCFFGCFGALQFACGRYIIGPSGSAAAFQDVGYCTKLTWVPFVAAFRTSDFMSDWAFYSITLRKGGLFNVLAVAQGVRYDAIRAAALAFCILGSILFAVEVPFGFILRSNLWGQEARISKKRSLVQSYQVGYGKAGYFWIPATTLLAMLFEDVPQLCLQTVYFKTVGFENADGISTFSFVMSAASLLINLVTALLECNKLRGAPESWSHYACCHSGRSKCFCC
jgi:hypothetical protein